MKKIFLGLLLVGLFMFVGCSSDLEEYSGTYKLSYYKYVGDPDTAKNTAVEQIILNEDGTGKSIRDGLDITVTWSIDGNNITLTETYIGTKIEYNGILENNKLDLFNGDKTNMLTIEKVYNKE